MKPITLYFEKTHLGLIVTNVTIITKNTVRQRCICMLFGLISENLSQSLVVTAAATHLHYFFVISVKLNLGDKTKKYSTTALYSLLSLYVLKPARTKLCWLTSTTDNIFPKRQCNNTKIPVIFFR